jgi:dihydrofolate reductase
MNLHSSIPRFSIIVAADEDGGIASNGNIPWDIPEDRTYFRQVTSATSVQSKRNCVIMGKNTYLTIPPKFRPFANRLNVVLSRSPIPDPEMPLAVLMRNSLEKAIVEASTDPSVETIFVIGGGEVYRQALLVDPSVAVCEKIYYTNVFSSFGCDCVIPSLGQLERDGFKRVPNTHPAARHGIQERNGLRYEYVTLERSA